MQIGRLRSVELGFGVIMVLAMLVLFNESSLKGTEHGCEQMIVGGSQGNDSVVRKAAQPDSGRVLLGYVFEAFKFTVAIMVAAAFAYFTRVRLRVGGEVVRPAGGPHVVLTNSVRDGPVEVKVSFEVFADVEGEDVGAFAGRLVRSDTKSLAAVPPAKKWRKPTKVLVPIPGEVLKLMEGGAPSRTALYVRATSVDPLTNFRSVSNTVKFAPEAV